MRRRLQLVSLVLILALGCESRINPDTERLTANEWMRFQILHRPPSGVTVTTTCKEFYSFETSNQYRKTTDCNTALIDGSWEWLKIGETLRVEPAVNGVMQKPYIVTIIELTSESLHTRERLEEEPDGTESYWEVTYVPRSN